MEPKKDAGPFLFCLSCGDHPASLEARKAYQAVPDKDSEALGLVRVIDESGEDYLYPQGLFVAMGLPTAATEALIAAGHRELA